MDVNKNCEVIFIEDAVWDCMKAWDICRKKWEEWMKKTNEWTIKCMYQSWLKVVRSEYVCWNMY